MNHRASTLVALEKKNLLYSMFFYFSLISINSIYSIDATMATDGIIQAIRGIKNTDFKDIINTDHRGFMIDLDMKKYFSVESSKHDQTDNVKLDSSKRTHRENFKEKLDEHIEQIKLEEIQCVMDQLRAKK